MCDCKNRLLFDCCATNQGSHESSHDCLKKSTVVRLVSIGHNIKLDDTIIEYYLMSENITSKYSLFEKASYFK